MGKKSKIEQTTVRALKFVMIECHYLEELQAALSHLKHEKGRGGLTPTEEQRGMKKCIEILKYLERAEKRAYRYENNLTEALNDVFHKSKWLRTEGRRKKFVAEHLKVEFNARVPDTLGQLSLTPENLRGIIEDFRVEKEKILFLAAVHGGADRSATDLEKLVALEKKIDNDPLIAEEEREAIENFNEKLGELKKYLQAATATIRKIQGLIKDHEDYHVNDDERLLDIVREGFVDNHLEIDEAFISSLREYMNVLHTFDESVLKGLYNFAALNFLYFSHDKINFLIRFNGGDPHSLEIFLHYVLPKMIEYLMPGGAAHYNNQLKNYYWDHISSMPVQKINKKIARKITDADLRILSVKWEDMASVKVNSLKLPVFSCINFSFFLAKDYNNKKNVWLAKWLFSIYPLQGYEHLSYWSQRDFKRSVFMDIARLSDPERNFYLQGCRRYLRVGKFKYKKVFFEMIVLFGKLNLGYSIYDEATNNEDFRNAIRDISMYGKISFHGHNTDEQLERVIIKCLKKFKYI